MRVVKQRLVVVPSEGLELSPSMLGFISLTLTFLELSPSVLGLKSLTLAFAPLLQQMIPDLRVWLDVDDLRDMRGLEAAIDSTRAVLVFCSSGYVESTNCMRELRHTVGTGKPIIALLELECRHGGLSPDQMREKLLAYRAADAQPSRGHVDQRPDQARRYSARRTELDRSTEVEESNGNLPHPPTGEEMADALFQEEPIEWIRLGPFQDVTLRLIAQRVLFSPSTTDEQRSLSANRRWLAHGVPTLLTLMLVRFLSYFAWHAAHGCIRRSMCVFAGPSSYRASWRAGRQWPTLASSRASTINDSNSTARRTTSAPTRLSKSWSERRVSSGTQTICVSLIDASACSSI